jgi:hypothetical protein
MFLAAHRAHGRFLSHRCFLSWQTQHARTTRLSENSAMRPEKGEKERRAARSTSAGVGRTGDASLCFFYEGPRGPISSFVCVDYRERTNSPRVARRVFFRRAAKGRPRVHPRFPFFSLSEAVVPAQIFQKGPEAFPPKKEGFLKGFSPLFSQTQPSPFFFFFFFQMCFRKGSFLFEKEGAKLRPKKSAALRKWKENPLFPRKGASSQGVSVPPACFFRAGHATGFLGGGFPPRAHRHEHTFRDNFGAFSGDPRGRTQRTQMYSRLNGSGGFDRPEAAGEAPLGNNMAHFLQRLGSKENTSGPKYARLDDNGGFSDASEAPVAAEQAPSKNMSHFMQRLARKESTKKSTRKSTKTAKSTKSAKKPMYSRLDANGGFIKEQEDHSGLKPLQRRTRDERGNRTGPAANEEADQQTGDAYGRTPADVSAPAPADLYAHTPADVGDARYAHTPADVGYYSRTPV